MSVLLGVSLGVLFVISVLGFVLLAYGTLMK